MRKIICFLLPLLLLCCAAGPKDGHGLLIGKGMEGKNQNNGVLVLNGDSFPIHEENSGDSLWVIYHTGAPDDPTPYYVVRLRPDGRYYAEVGGQRLSLIDNSSRYVGKDDSLLYDLDRGEVVLTTSVNTCGLWRLGEWNGLQLFMNDDHLLFSDGKIVPLQDNVNCFLPERSEELQVTAGAYRQCVPLKLLHDATMPPVKETDASVECITLHHMLEPLHPDDHKEKLGPDRSTLHLGLQLPKGQSQADRAVREWMQKEVVADLAVGLPESLQRPVPKGQTLDDAKASLNQVVNWWSRNFREVLEKDTTGGNADISISVNKVADCADYTTYHYHCCIVSDAWNPHKYGYYITYDKHRNCFLHADNAVKPALVNRFRRKALECLKDQFEAYRESKLSWKEFTDEIFSYHSSAYEDEQAQRGTKRLTPLIAMYVCDGWAGGKGYNEVPFTEADFPLTHLALLPEGVVLTYHNWQISAINDNDYHALVPYDSVADCLNFSYSRSSAVRTGLQNFFRFSAK